MMAELIEALISWPTLLFALAAFGFAPGAVLRLLVHAYPKGDLRRRELLAELYAIPRIERPLWIAEQLELAIFEGLAKRWSERKVRRTSHSSENDQEQQEESSPPAALQSARLTEPSDGTLATIVTEARMGDQQAWRELVTRYAGLVWSVARSHQLDHADAADVCQTTWLRLAENFSTLEDPLRVPGWLAITARHEALRVVTEIKGSNKGKL
jgi:Sigma-70 region 2